MSELSNLEGFPGDVMQRLAAMLNLSGFLETARLFPSVSTISPSTFPDQKKRLLDTEASQHKAASVRRCCRRVGEGGGVNPATIVIQREPVFCVCVQVMRTHKPPPLFR